MSHTTPGYRAILIQDKTFDQLKQFWRDGDDRDENALARLATALIELGLKTESHRFDARLNAKQMHLRERMQALPNVMQVLMETP